jgi:pilus assembly protein Flp/PilA
MKGREMTWLRERLKSERGASLVEYALLLALIAVVCISAVAFLGNNSSSGFDKSGSSIRGNETAAETSTTLPGGGADHCEQHGTITDPSGWVHWTVHADGSVEPYTSGPC